MDILTGEILASISVANMDLTYWSGRSSNRRGGERVIGVHGEYLYFSQLCIRLHEILVQHPSNNISIEMSKLYLIS